MSLWYDTISELSSGASPEEAVALLKERDPMLKKLSLLPENVRKREEFFITQSAKGFLGWINRQ